MGAPTGAYAELMMMNGFDVCCVANDAETFKRIFKLSLNIQLHPELRHI